MNPQLILAVIEYLVLFCILAFVLSAVTPTDSILSSELKRRVKRGDKDASRSLNRKLYSRDISSYRVITLTFLIFLISLLSSGIFGVYIGLLFTLFFVVTTNIIAKLPLIVYIVERVYQSIENQLYKFFDFSKSVNKFLYGVFQSEIPEFSVHSPEELLDIIKNSEGVLGKGQIYRSKTSLNLEKILAKDIMAGKRSIKSINKNELLGPLVLNDLHNMGFDCVPVVGRDINHIVGLLHVNELLTTDNKHSLSVTDAMRGPVYYVHESADMVGVLSLFASSKSPIVIVVDRSEKTKGLLALSDVAKVILGELQIATADSTDLQEVSKSSGDSL